MLRTASAAALLVTATLLTPVLPAQDKDASAQTTESASKDARSTKDTQEVKHKKAAKNHDSQGTTGAAAAKPDTPKK